MWFKAKCLGIRRGHRWGQWAEYPYTSTLLQFRFCERCGYRQSRRY